MEEIKLKNGILTFKRKLKKEDTYKISKGRKYTTLTIFKKPQLIKGIASYCEDGKHVLFIDYDDVPRWLVEEDYGRLQADVGLPAGYLFTTGESKGFGNYHVICLAKFNPKEIYEMIAKTHADINYASMPLRNKYRNWTLRIGTKLGKERPRFISLIGEKINSTFQISTSHLTLLTKLYPEIQHPRWLNQDNLDSVYMQDYEAL